MISAVMARTFLVCLAMARFAEAGFIDMDTPLDRRTATSFVDGTVYDLVSYNMDGNECELIL